MKTLSFDFDGVLTVKKTDSTTINKIYLNSNHKSVPTLGSYKK